MNIPVIGIDVSKKKFDVALLIGDRFWTKSYENKQSGFESLHAWIQGKNISPHLCMESTGIYSHALANFLFERQYTVSMVNPARIKGFGKSELIRNKTDEADAKLIARFCLAMKPNVWKPEPQWQTELKQWVHQRDSLVQLERMERNRLESAVPSVQKAIKQHLRSIVAQIEQANEYIEALIRNQPELQRNAELLDSIPGLGKVSIAAILANIGQIDRFSSPKKLSAFIGLNPCQRQSGTSVRGRTKLSKIGNSQFRKSLYMPALVAIRYNPILKRFYQDLLKRGKAKMVAIGAVMRRLVHIVYGVLKHQTPFSTDCLPTVIAA